MEGEVAVVVGEVEASHLAGGGVIDIFDRSDVCLLFDELLGAGPRREEGVMGGVDGDELLFDL